MGLEGTGLDWSGSSFRRRRNVAAELPRERKGAEGKGKERTGLDWSGSSFRRRRDVAAELPMDGIG